MFRRLFIANRGEVAARIARTCDAMGITPVFGVSTADADAPYVRGREHIVLGGGAPSASYLDAEKVVRAAKDLGASALHPGWGFLSENPRLARLCEDRGITFVGPPAHVMFLMGTKTPAKRAMGKAGLTLIAGSDGILANEAEAQAAAERAGFPVLFKAEYGGGGRGMRIARSKAEVAQAFADATAESRAAFGNGSLYLEKLVEGGRHIEIQILADRYGNVVHLGDRDCTVQRNHQKLIEESPSPVLEDAVRERTLRAACLAAGSIGYVGAGTMEFLLDDTGTLRFMEMNTRLQVEHCVSEMRSGVDLVREQIRVAAGEKLSLAQGDIQLKGHAIECRINAEDPSEGFRPSPGTIQKWVPPTGEGIRVDTHVESGYVIPTHYDSLIAKVIAHGATRSEATTRLIAALESLVAEGIKTTVPMHLAVLRSAAFQSSRYDTGAIPGWPTATPGKA